MDKYDLVLDIIEHPEKYTSDQLAEILSEPETREIYTLLCKTESAIKDYEKPNVSTEWKRFSNSINSPAPIILMVWQPSRINHNHSRVLSIAAVAAGIAITVSVIDYKSEPIAKNMAVAPFCCGRINRYDNGSA